MEGGGEEREGRVKGGDIAHTDIHSIDMGNCVYCASKSSVYSVFVCVHF